MKPIVLSHHARLKLEVLARHGLPVAEKAVVLTLRQPDRIEEGYRGRRVAQKRVSDMSCV